jgi:hypothetical protein
VTILLAIIRVRPTVILVVPSRAFHAIVKSAALNVIEFRGECIPLRRRRRRLTKLRTLSSHQVRHRTVVAAPKSIAECVSLFRRKLRVPKSLMIVDVGMTVHLEIFSCRFNPFMETLPLNFIQFLRWNIPAVAGRRWSLLAGSSAGHRRNRDSQEQSNCRN